jgi:hypothetical protein
MATKEAIPFYQKVTVKLKELERGNRWLIGKMKDGYGIELTDTQLSNRLKDVHPFKVNEMMAVREILGIKK